MSNPNFNFDMKLILSHPNIIPNLQVLKIVPNVMSSPIFNFDMQLIVRTLRGWVPWFVLLRQSRLAPYFENYICICPIFIWYSEASEIFGVTFLFLGWNGEEAAPVWSSGGESSGNSDESETGDKLFRLLAPTGALLVIFTQPIWCNWLNRVTPSRLNSISAIDVTRIKCWMLNAECQTSKVKCWMSNVEFLTGIILTLAKQQ